MYGRPDLEPVADPICWSVALSFGPSEFFTLILFSLTIIAVLIGLFAISEVIAMVWHPTAHLGKTRQLGSSWVSFADCKKSFKSIVRCSFIGVFLGSIPGIGAAPAAFLSYSEARRKSPKKKELRQGRG